MLSVLFWIVVGVLVGWHLPEPEWVKSLVSKVMGLVKK